MLNRRHIFLSLSAFLALGLGGIGLRSTNGRYYAGPVSDHFDGERFFDPYGAPPKSLFDLLRWWSSNGKAEWPDWAPSALSDRPPPRVNGSACRLSFVGHASFLLQTAGLNILIDPIWSERASPVSFAGPKRVNDPGIAWDALPRIDVVLVSHGHYDHLDVDTLSRLHAAFRPRLVTALGQDAIIREHNADIAAQAHDWGARIELAAGVAVTLVPVRHWSARTLFDGIRRYGPASSSKRRPGRSCTYLIPVMETAGISAMCATCTGPSASPCCRSAPTNRAGSCASST